MAEYIERELLLEAVARSLADNPHKDGKVHANHRYEHEHFSYLILKQPAADVAPVRHGRWNADETCSCCGEKSTEGLDAEKWNYWFPDYCPHCGAKMDLEGKHDP